MKFKIISLTRWRVKRNMYFLKLLRHYRHFSPQKKKNRPTILTIIWYTYASLGKLTNYRARMFAISNIQHRHISADSAKTNRSIHRLRRPQTLMINFLRGAVSTGYYDNFRQLSYDPVDRHFRKDCWHNHTSEYLPIFFLSAGKTVTQQTVRRRRQRRRRWRRLRRQRRRYRHYILDVEISYVMLSGRIASIGIRIRGEKLSTYRVDCVVCALIAFGLLK